MRAHRAVNLRAAGSATAGMIAISALTMWVLAQPAVAGADTALQQVLLAVAFASGGPGFAIFLALTITALVGPARRTGILRTPAIVTGYMLIVVAVVGCIGLAWSPAFAVLPLARFGGLAWLHTQASPSPPHAHGVASHPRTDI